MELKDFIGMENPWEYNFEFECNDENYTRLCTFERFFTYKLLTDNDKSCHQTLPLAKEFIDKRLTMEYKTIIDPDGSDGMDCLAHEIYNRLWDWKKNEKNTFGKMEDKFDMGEFGADTINSATNPISQLTGKNSWRKNLNCWLNDRPKYETLAQNAKADKYINAYHTLGNFVLVPAHFNKQRGSNLRLCGKKINDYWDLSLEYLQKNGYSDFTPDCFTTYINYFFLWDYVNPVNNSCYEINPIGMTKLTDERNISDFFKTATNCIKRRGIFMTALLRLKTSEEDELKKVCKDYFDFIQGKDFLSKAYADGFNEAIGKLKELLEGKGDDAEQILTDLSKMPCCNKEAK